MNDTKPVFLAILMSILVAGPAISQDIYKTVDENGNVVYTDQKPSEDAEPVDLPELTVVDPVELGNEEAMQQQAASEGDSEAQEAPDLDLRIVSPLPEEQIVNTGYVLDVRLALEGEVPSDAQVVYRIDGETRETSNSLSATLENIERGPHELTVEVLDASDRVLASDSVSFFMRQNSRLHPRPG